MWINETFTNKGIIMQELTQKYVKSLFAYKNGELYWMISKAKRIKINDKAGSLNKVTGYYSLVIDGKRYYNHRLIYLYHYGYFPNKIDHIDGDKSNNLIENLRSVTQSQNLMNSKSAKNSSSKYKGVYYHKKAKKWVSQIQINGKLKYLGLFTSETDAAIAYNKAAIEYFDEYAYLNNINGDAT